MTDIPAENPSEVPPMDEPVGIPDGEQPIQPDVGGPTAAPLA